MGDNVIELKEAAAGIAEKPAKVCFCCGAGHIEQNTARIFNCDCEQKIYGMCEVCRYCKKHCRCTPRMKELRDISWRFYQDRIEEIRGVFSENVNQK